MPQDRDRLDARATSDEEEMSVLIDSLLPVLVDRLDETGLGEIEVERNGATIRVRAARAGAPVSAAATASPSAAAAPAGAAAAAGPRKQAVRSTAVGFVTLSSEVHVGAKVAKGGLVAVIDTLGVANEVRAEQGGIVAVLRCATGDPVEYGQELLLLESLGEGAR